MMIKKYNSHQIILNLLIFLIIASPFLIYKYVDYFRANQELWVKLISFFILFLILLKIVSGKNIVLSKDKLSFLLIIFFLYLSSSLIYSSSRVLSSRFLFLFFCYVFLSLLIINLKINNKTELLINVFIISALLISSYTILHYYGLIRYFAEFGPIFSPIGQKNWTSNLLSLILPSSFAFYLLENEKFKKYFYFMVIIIIYTTILICQSRGIWISILLTIPMAFLLIKKGNLTNIFIKNRKNLSYLFLILIIITVIYSTDNPLNKSPLTVPQRAFSVFDREDTSTNMRLIMLYSSLKMIHERPLLGFGLGTFNLNYPDFQALYLQEKPGMIRYLGDHNVLEAHNEYIQFASEIGVIGLLQFLVILLFFYKNSWNFLKAKGVEPKNKVINLGLFLGINIFLIHCLFTFPFHVPFLGASFFILLGLANFLPMDNLGSCRSLTIHIELRKSLKIFAIVGLTFIFMISAYLFIIKPYLSEVYSFQGQKAYFIDDDLDEAIHHFEKAVRLNPCNGRILLHLGATYFNSGLFQEALPTLIESRKYYTDKNIIRNLGLSYMQSGNYPEAEKELKQAIYLYPNFSEAYIDLAYLHAIQENYDEAIAQWNKVLEIEPNFSEKYNVLYYLGLTYVKKGMPDKALEYFLQALVLVPEGDPIEQEIEEEINEIYKSKLEK